MKYTFATLVIDKTNIDELINMFKSSLYDESYSPLEELVNIKKGIESDDLMLFSAHEGTFQYISNVRRFYYQNGYYDLPDVETLAAFLMLPTRKSREVFLEEYSSIYMFKAVKDSN